MQELNVKVGDKVAYSYGGWNGRRRRITEVIKITPTGRIRVKQNPKLQFDKYGYEMGNCGCYRVFLEELTPELERKIVEEETIMLCFQKIEKIRELDYETAVKLLAVLEGGGQDG